jgi:hypothetical protein
MRSAPARPRRSVFKSEHGPVAQVTVTGMEEREIWQLFRQQLRRSGQKEVHLEEIGIQYREPNGRGNSQYVIHVMLFSILARKDSSIFRKQTYSAEQGRDGGVKEYVEQ